MHGEETIMDNKDKEVINQKIYYMQLKLKKLQKQQTQQKEKKKI